MTVQLTINTHPIEAIGEGTLFDFAESVGVQVPTSCHKQGKCRECMMEVTQGLSLLSERTGPEDHLPENFRLSCCTQKS